MRGMLVLFQHLRMNLTCNFLYNLNLCVGLTFMEPPNTKVGHITGQVDIETQRNTVDISVKACCLLNISLIGKNQHCIVSIQQNLLETNSKAYVIYVFWGIFGHLLRLGEAKLNNGGASCISLCHNAS